MGTQSLIGSLQIIKPQACTPVPLTVPSSFFAYLIVFRTFSSGDSSACLSSGIEATALVKFILRSLGSLSGMLLHRQFAWSNGTLSTRATSFKEFFVAIVPYVIMCAQFSCPYLFSTHSSTSPRPSSSKSVSISGKEIRSGFKKRSKSKSYLMGSIFVIPKQQATTEPAADPLPGPTITPSSFLAVLMKSCTIKKQPGKPIVFMICSSNLIRSSTSSVKGSPYNFFAPSQASLAKQSASNLILYSFSIPPNFSIFFFPSSRDSWFCPFSSEVNSLKRSSSEIDWRKASSVPKSSGIGQKGIMGALSIEQSSILSKISQVLRIASGKSPNTSFISSFDLNHSCFVYRRRLGSFKSLLVDKQIRWSCASASSFSIKCTSLVHTTLISSSLAISNKA